MASAVLDAAARLATLVLAALVIATRGGEAGGWPQLGNLVRLEGRSQRGYLRHLHHLRYRRHGLCAAALPEGVELPNGVCELRDALGPDVLPRAPACLAGLGEHSTLSQVQLKVLRGVEPNDLWPQCGSDSFK